MCLFAKTATYCIIAICVAKMTEKTSIVETALIGVFLKDAKNLIIIQRRLNLGIAQPAEEGAAKRIQKNIFVIQNKGS